MEMLQTLEIEPLSDYELEHGKPIPSKNHAITQSNLIALLWSNYRKEFRILSECTLEFGRRFTPDLCIFTPMLYQREIDEITLSQVPITAVEILSPKQNADDIMEKFEVYFTNGIKSGWFVMPSTDTIFVLTPDKKIRVFHDEILTDSVTDISVDLKEVFN